MLRFSEGQYALGGLTVFAIWLFVGLPWLLTSNWGLSDKIAVVASVVAFLQFLALIATIWVMIDNGRRQLRAYISMDGGSIKIITVGQDHFVQGFVNLKNCGQTPARNCRSWVRIQIGASDNSPFDQTSFGKGGSIIGPGVDFNLPVHWPLSVVDLAAIRAETKRIYIWGETEYVDVFGRDRYFKFYQWNGKEIPSKGWPLENSDRPQQAN
jgi:uncharacterized membrane protein